MMDLKEFYTAVGGNYQNVMARLPSEQLIRKFLLKFKQDGSYALLLSSVKAGDQETAFRAAHTLKGVCQNLGIDRLLESSSAITEALRHGETASYENLLEKVTVDYDEAIDNLNKLFGDQA